jgi:predicted hydrocarbon binding protein
MMRGHELLLEHFAKIYNEGGRYLFGAERVALMPPDFIRGIHDAVAREVGRRSAAMSVIDVGFDTGFIMGELAIEQIDDPLEQMRSVGSVTRLLGLVESALPRQMNEEGDGHYELHWYGSIDQESGCSPQNPCYFVTGFASGYLSSLSDDPIFFLERECVSQGAEHCIADGMTLDSWADDQPQVAAQYGIGKARFHRTLADIEKAYILDVIDVTDTREEAAEILGISVATLFRRLKTYGIT